jgi:hypothetical protein
MVSARYIAAMTVIGRHMDRYLMSDAVALTAKRSDWSVDGLDEGAFPVKL